MKVYILVRKDYSFGDLIEGVFKNEEDADKMWDSFDLPYQEEYRIQEHEVIE